MYEPLLTAPYILDLDPTVKVMYGQQEGAEIGYNPQKPGRPSQSYHTYFIGNLRLVLDVEIHSGKEVAGCYSHPRLWSLMDSMPVQCLPHLIRGDIGFGNEGTMLGCEERGLFFLFKLKQTKNIKSLILSLEKTGGNWKSIGQGWFGSEGKIQLMGWSKARKVVVLRRAHFKKKNLELPTDSNQRELLNKGSTNKGSTPVNYT